MNDAAFRAGLQAIAPMLRQEVDEGLMAGSVTMVWRRGELVHSEAIGHRDIAAGLPMTDDTLVRLASMTKPIVSLAALMLVEEGTLGLGDRITRWLPELADRRVLADPKGPLDDSHASPREITVEDLLTHRSGLAAGFTASGPISAAYADRLRLALFEPMAIDEWLTRLATIPLRFAPGTCFQYGHSTDVLGFLLARIENKPLSAVLRERIFEPLGMADTAFWTSDEKCDRLAKVYELHLGPTALSELPFPELPTPPAFESGGGGLISTAVDYLKFARLLLGGGEVDGRRLVSAKTVRMMAANRMTRAQLAHPFLGVRDYWAGQGFGLGLATVLDPAAYAPAGAASAGSFGWPGAFGTWWMADPIEEMILIFLAQDFFTLTPDTAGRALSGTHPGARRAQRAFQQIVYAALRSS